MRILLLTNGLGFGGAERIVEALARDLSAAGDEILVVATTRDGPIGASLRAAGIRTEILGIRSAIDARVIARLARIALRFQPEVVHSHLAVSDIAAAMAPLGAARVTTIHNSGVELDPLKRRAWHLALRRFDRLLPVGLHVAAALPDGLRSIEVLSPSLVDLARTTLDRAAARQRLGLDAHAPLVLGVGRLARIKGFDVLARAKPLLADRGAVVAVIGDGPEPPEGLELLGARDDAAELMAAADVVVCPSRSEGFPQVPLQAMAASVPVVATRVGGTPEVVLHERTGLLVPPEDPAALAAAIDRLLADPARAAELGREGRARLDEAGLTRARMIEAHRRVYAEIRR